MTSHPSQTSPASTRSDFPHVGTGLYYALSACPATLRPALQMWMNWWHETARIPFDVHDPGVAETKLRWWQQAVAEAANGRAEHPLLKGLLAPGTIVPPARLPDWPCWQAQLDGLIQLVHQTRWLDEKTLDRHERQTTGEACAGAACLLGASSGDALAVAARLGVGLRRAHELARLGQDARAGWVNVSIDLLQQHGVRAHEISKPDRAKVPDGWPALLQHLHDRAAREIEGALASLRALPHGQARAMRPLVVLAHIHLRQIKVIAGQGDRVLHERIVLTPIVKWWIAQRVKWGLLG